MSDTTTIHRDALNKLDPVDSAKSDRDSKAESFNLEFNVGELYGCVCHRPTTGIFTRRSIQDQPVHSVLKSESSCRKYSF